MTTDVPAPRALRYTAAPGQHVVIPAQRRPADRLPADPLPVPVPRRPGAAYAVLNAVAAALLILATVPVLVAVAIAVKLDGGPVLFRQTRVGRDGRRFRMVKFRSMVVDAESRLAALVEQDEGAGPLFKMTRDPRVTRVGRFLRASSLDELPQLFNVVAGQMALVGPRPALPREVAAYCPAARRRLHATPGLTGLWQVSGRSNLTWDESVRLDAAYVETWSPALDARILVRTVGAVLRGGGAY